MDPWFVCNTRESIKKTEERNKIMQEQIANQQSYQQARVYQDSPGREHLIQLAGFNAFLDGFTAAVKALATLDQEHQKLALDTMSRLMGLPRT